MTKQQADRFRALLAFTRSESTPNSEGLSWQELIELTKLHDRLHEREFEETEDYLLRKLELMEKGWGESMDEQNKTETDVVTVETKTVGWHVARRAANDWRLVSVKPGGGKTELTFARGPELEIEAEVRERQELEASLQPCPFCGAAPEVGDDSHVICLACGCGGPYDMLMPERSLERWNERAVQKENEKKTKIVVGDLDTGCNCLQYRDDLSLQVLIVRNDGSSNGFAKAAHCPICKAGGALTPLTEVEVVFQSEKENEPVESQT